MKYITYLFVLFFYIVSSITAQPKLVDLTYSFDENTIYWPTADGFHLINESHGMTENGYYYSSNKFSTAEHGGTHLDAPIHFYKDGITTENIPLENLYGNAVVIDASEVCDTNRDYLFNVADFELWEKKYGTIAEGSIILLKSGYGKYWPDRKSYMGTAEIGSDAVANLHFPGLHEDGAKWLVEKRKIKAIGIDTPSIDFGQSKLFKAHVVLASNNIPIFENVANLNELPVSGFKVIALPMKIKGGSGGPARIIAIFDNE
ncbi:MAG: cyclase family protein [Melioribacteraceae bacterium]|nr:cyclase family protein [Melioribacteraceae bacterium]